MVPVMAFTSLKWAGLSAKTATVWFHKWPSYALTDNQDGNWPFEAGHRLFYDPLTVSIIMLDKARLCSSCFVKLEAKDDIDN
jgi:hypothetical protein